MEGKIEKLTKGKWGESVGEDHEDHRIGLGISEKKEVTKKKGGIFNGTYGEV